MSTEQQPPRKKRKLNEMVETKTNELNEDHDADCLLDSILRCDINQLFGDKVIFDTKLERLSLKLNALQKEICVRISNSNTLSLADRLRKSVNCTRAYVGDGDGNTDYESWHCKSNGTFVIGPNKKKIQFDFNGAQGNGGSIYEGFIGFHDIWSIEDIEEDKTLELYYSRKNTKKLIQDSGYDLKDNDKNIDNFAEILTIICLQIFRKKANAHWSGNIDVDFDFKQLWTKRNDLDQL